NTFDALTANTSGTVTIINRTGVLQLNAGATESCSNNLVTNGFVCQSAGTFNVFNGTGNSLNGNFVIQNNNNFSNLSGAASIINGWNNDVGTATSGPAITIANNIFS